ncbi:hypothetical protein GQ55_7G190700 [Panicum hallii var. hallii]|uniref:Uncharacterized protein n=1 Tax=Panicum hallii var. hallii TaxID=1504633 RepID=A0A2T7CWL6_9POAL|nr:hypothetical protein GQ55_7G190700 [Panicum hallii var. hallii]
MQCSNVSRTQTQVREEIIQTGCIQYRRIIMTGCISSVCKEESQMLFLAAHCSNDLDMQCA